jgi:hypothetical protein
VNDGIFVNPTDEQVKEIVEDPAKTYPDLIQQVKKVMDDFASLTCEEQAVTIVYEFVRSHLDPSDEKYASFGISEVYVVQFTYILGNWRAMVSTSLPDGMYYEVVYAKHRGSARLDAYKRSDHQEFFVSAVPGPDLEIWAKGTVADHFVSAQAYPVNRSMLTISIISSVYIIGCWKALISPANFDDGVVYEITFDPRKRVAYLDPYKLFESREIAIPSKPAA